jgi:hypothetical protein
LEFVATRPSLPRRTLTNAEPWTRLSTRQQTLVRLQHTNPEIWWWRFDGSLAVCVAPPLEHAEPWRRGLYPSDSSDGSNSSDGA